MARGGGIHNSLRDLQEEIKGLKVNYQRLEESVKKSGSLNELARRLDIEKVYSLLEDRESQELFWARLHFSQNGDLAPLFRYLMQTDRRGDPKDIIWFIKSRMSQKKPEDELVLFGTTGQARELLTVMRTLGCKVDYICAADDPSLFTHSVNQPLKNFDWFGIPVISEAELLEKHRDAQIVIGYIKYWVAMPYLLAKGFPEERIWRRFSLWDKQYLDPEIMRPHEHEVYVDAGVYDWTSSREFAEWCGGKYDAIYGFEPDEDSYEDCLKKLKDEPALDGDKVHLFRAALWKQDEALVFQDDAGAGSHVSDMGDSVVRGQALDNVLQGAPVTFIKMDVEGAEMNALRGARESIKKWKPRLAICIYHKPEDPIEIPLYIHGLVPEYRMYIRHYSTTRDETVLYCVCDEHLK